VKITRLGVSGFRAFATPQSIRLREGQSLCLLAENGRGKTSLIDALEFWSSGDVSWVHQDGVGLGALTHVDADEAAVEVRIDGVGVATRRLRGGKATGLEPESGPLEVGYAPPVIPILRYRTMAEFVDKSANDKRAELLALLGLDELAAFRLGVRRIARITNGAVKDAHRNMDEARKRWVAALAGQSAEVALGELSRAAKLEVPIRNEDELLQWKPPSREARGVGGSGPLQQADELAEAISEFARVRPGRWTAATAARGVAEEQALSALVEAGKKVLAGWGDETCPLCLQAKEKSELEHDLAQRAEALAKVDEEFRKAESELAGYRQIVGRVIRAVGSLVDGPQPVDWPEVATLNTYREQLRDFESRLATSQRTRSSIPEPPRSLSEGLLQAVRACALRAPADVGPALLALSRLQGDLGAVRRAVADHDEAVSRSAAFKAAAEITDESVEAAINKALAKLNGPLGSYYGQLVGIGTYSDVKLEYRSDRVGGIEFSVVWDGRVKVTPPQRIMSESQLNALGMALFLARLKVDGSDWRTIALDDVVAAFDSIHRTRLVRLLESEFAEWQILLCTHDQHLSRTVEVEARSWKSLKVKAWTPKDGPSLDEAEPRKRLARRLQDGEAADEMGGLARQAMERALERPVRKLGLKIRHDLTNTYAAEEYRRALIDGLRDGGFSLVDEPVLQRLATDGSVTNRACHFKDVDPGVTSEDLRVLLEDLQELDELFRCAECGKNVWEIRDARSLKNQCKCGGLTCA
jgi:hypothetical protein